MTHEKAAKGSLLIVLLVFGLSARGWTDTQIEVASPVTVISRESLEELGIQSVGDVLESTSMTIVTPREMHLILAEQALLDGSDVQALLNGSDFHGVADAVPIRDIDRVEIIKGPAAATLYGAEASADMINFTRRRDYLGYPLNRSWVFNEFWSPLSRLWISTEHSGECDTTNAVGRPFWSISRYQDWAGPRITDNGNTWLYGSQSEGFLQPGYRLPQTRLFDFEGTDFADLESMRQADFTVLADLVERVENDPSISEEAKNDFWGSLGFFLAFGDPMSLSDAAFAFGDFDPDDMYDAFIDYAASAPTGAAPATPRTQTGDRPTPTNIVAAGEQPLPAPFTGYPYPMEYLLDDPNDCPDEIKKKVRVLIREREQARADVIHYADYLGNEWRDPRETAERARKADEARKLRDQKNDEIKTLLRDCVPQTATTEDSQTSSSTPDTPSGDEAQSTSNLRRNDDWRLEIRVSYNKLGDDGEVHKEPAQGVFLGLHENKFGSLFSLPTIDAFKHVDLGASDSGQQQVTDLKGRAFFNLSDLEPRLGLRWEVPSEWRGNGPESCPQSGGDAESATSSEWGLKSDWGFGVRYCDKTIEVYTTVEKIHSFNLVLPGQGGQGSPAVLHVPTGLFMTHEWNLGRNKIVTLDVAEWVKLDLSALETIPGLASIENNACGAAALPPNGLGYLGQASVQVQSVEDQWALEHVGLTNDPVVSEARSSDATPVVIGVIDTGLDWNHLDFAWENIWRNEDEIPDNGVDDDDNGFVDDIIGWNFVNRDNKPWDNDGHGTFVAGIIAATRNNGAGIDGINPNARIMVLKALNNFGRTRASYIAQAIVYGADNGARILNLSVSGGEVPGVVIDALAYARAKGVLVIAAAGNRGEDVDRGPPGGVQGLMSVAATDPDDKRAVFSNVGSLINIAAPGVDIVSLRARRTDFMLNSATTTYRAGGAYLGRDKRYYLSAGTSFATPIVSGIASLVWSTRPELAATQVQRILEQSARDVETPGRDRFTGYGVVDAQAALRADPEFFVDAAILLAQRTEEDGHVFVQLFGTADASQFGRAWLEIGEGEDPSLWIPVGDALPGAVRLGVLGRIPADQLDGAKVWTVRVISEHQNGRQQEARHVIELG